MVGWVGQMRGPPAEIAVHRCSVEQSLQRVVMVHHRLEETFLAVGGDERFVTFLVESVALVVGDPQTRVFVGAKLEDGVDRAVDEAGECDVEGLVFQHLDVRPQRVFAGNEVVEDAPEVGHTNTIGHIGDGHFEVQLGETTFGFDVRECRVVEM